MKEPLYIQVNNWRLWPRLFSIIYVILIFQVGSWFMSVEDPNEWQAAFATVVVSSGAAFFKFYVNSGPQPNKE